MPRICSKILELSKTGKTIKGIAKIVGEDRFVVSHKLQEAKKYVKNYDSQ